MSKTYKTHDNYLRPYIVEIQEKKVSVSKNMDEQELVDGEYIVIPKQSKHLFTKTADEIFIGKKSPNGYYDGLKPSKSVGNSILLKIGSTYMFIGHEIYEFKPIDGDSIVKYYSNIGNNDVPYPYAIGKTHVYIMLDRVAVKKSYFDMKQEIYKQFYYDSNIRDCLNGFGDKTLCKDKTHKLKTKMIVKRFS